MKRKNRNKKKIVPSGIPTERIAADILGDLSVTENSNRYILVINVGGFSYAECRGYCKAWDT